MNGKPNPRYDECPVCGGRKRGVSSVCSLCKRSSLSSDAEYRIDWNSLTQEWISEFCGLFAGEGHVNIVRNNTSYAPMIALRLRDDDEAVIQEIRLKLGGRILRSRVSGRVENAGDQVEWRSTNLPHVKDLCEMILKYSRLPNKKLNDVRQVLDFCDWRFSIGYHFSDGERMEAERRLSELRVSRKYR